SGIGEIMASVEDSYAIGASGMILAEISITACNVSGLDHNGMDDLAGAGVAIGIGVNGIEGTGEVIASVEDSYAIGASGIILAEISISGCNVSGLNHDKGSAGAGVAIGIEGTGEVMASVEDSYVIGASGIILAEISISSCNVSGLDHNEGSAG